MDNLTHGPHKDDLSPYEVHERLEADVAYNSPSMTPVSIMIPELHKSIPAGTYKKNDSGIWTRIGC